MARRSRLWRAGLASLRTFSFVCLGAACTDAGLRTTPDPPGAKLDDKLSLEGRVCTSDPTGLVFPVKVVFVIDSSQSMLVSDPPDPVPDVDTGDTTGRQRAVRAVIDTLTAENPDGVGFSIINFAGTSQILTGCDNDPAIPGIDDSLCFTNNAIVLDTAIDQLAYSGGVTNYQGALGNAFSVLTDDMQEVDEISLARSKYVVLFLSDGLPDTDDAQETENILAAVEDMAELARANRVGRFSFNAAYLSTYATPEIATAAETLLRAMSEIGQGTFRSYPNGEAINFLTVDLTSLRRAFTLSTIVAVNENAVLDDLEILVDSDGDTLADVLEDVDGSGTIDTAEDTNGDGVLEPTEDLNCSGVLDAGEDLNGNAILDVGEDLDCDGFLDVTETDPRVRDTDGYGFNDGLEVKLGFNPVDPPNLPPPPAQPQPEDCVLDIDKLDVDGDGFRDCEERFYGTNRLSFDSDRDGLPDSVEVRFGTNPVDDDAESDTDFDHTPNAQEVRTFGDPRNNDNVLRAERSYRYQVLSDGLDGSRSCREFRIDNITLVETLDDGWNTILIYAGQVPFDDPGSAVDYRVACIRARFLESQNLKDPPGGFLEVAEEDFHPPACAITDPDCVPMDLESDCIGPRR